MPEGRDIRKGGKAEEVGRGAGEANGDAGDQAKADPTKPVHATGRGHRGKKRSQTETVGGREVTGRHVIEWIEKYCRIPEGKHVGQLVRLTSHQKRWLKRIYDSPTRTFILSMARKNAKTALSAFLLLVHLVGPKSKPNSQLFSAAQSRDQAAILFSLAAKVVRFSPDLRATVMIRDTAKQLYCAERGTLYRALSADASTAYGLSPAFVVHDELGQVRGARSELYEALETAAGAQAEPISIIISTQAPNDGDLLSMLIDDALTGTDPTKKVELYTAPEDGDAFSVDSIRAANPHFDEFMNQEEVKRQAAEAQRLPSREASYRNLILNQRVEAKAPFITKQIWLENAGAPEKLKPKDKVFGGLDLSAVADLTALVLIHQVGELIDVHPSFWLPEDGLAEKSRLDKETYDVWSKQGLLLTTPGASIEYEFIADYLRGIFDAFDVQAMAFDRYNMKFLKPWLEQAGFTEAELAKFVEFGQGFVSMSPAIRELESLLLARKMRHGKHPVLTMCMANATVATDPAENRKFVKGKATGRIDGAVALAMAVGAKMLAPPVEVKKFQFFAL